MSHNIGGIVLCGGKSARFGSDKGAYIFSKKELIRYSIDLLKKFTKEVVVVGPKIISDSSIKFVQDIFPNCGPMGGIHAGLTFSKYSKNIVLSCDIPFLEEVYIQNLINSERDTDIQIFKTPDQQLHPLIGLYHKNLISELENNLKNDRFKLIDFIKKHKHSIIQLSEPTSLRSFTNINYLHEIHKYES